MYSDLIDLACQIVHNIRCQSYHEASLKIPRLTSSIESSEQLSSLIANLDEDFYYIFVNMSSALSSKDYVLFADILEESFIPFIKSVLVFPENETIFNYSIEPSSSGFKTIKYIPSDIYLHSNCNPLEEARTLVDFYYDENYSSYIVYGLGLGYHIKTLYDFSMESIKIDIYESDINLINYVKENDFLNITNTNDIRIIHDPTGKLFSNHLSKNNVGLLFHYPSILKIDNDDLRIHIKRFYTSWNSFYQWKRKIRINFNKNIINCPQNILSQKEFFKNKNIYLVGGGPSVDSNITLLKNLDRRNNVIVCVTTVLRILLEQDIVPDYAVVMDAQERTYGHMNGIENCAVPLIIDSAAFWKFGQYHKGVKYLALQKGYSPAEEVANKNNYPVFETGGTVTTLALDIAIKFQAKNIYFVGIDMAFPNGKTHASGSMDESKINSLISIKDVNGNLVCSDELMLGYLKEIEEKIRKAPEINFYNLSPFGANIHGCKNLNGIK